MTGGFTSEIYSDWMKSTQGKKYKDVFLDFILPLKGNMDLEKDKILDIGIGKGWFEKKLHERGVRTEVFGLDVEKTDLATDSVNFIVGDGDYMPFKDSCFDMVISFDTIHILKNPGEIERVIKKGGFALISTYCNERNFKEKAQRIKSLFGMKELKEGLVGDPNEEMSYVVLFKKGP